MAIELATAYVSIVPSTEKLESGIKTALNRAERDLKIAPTVDTTRMHSGFTQAGRAGSESFLGAFKTYTQQGMSPVGTALGLTVGRTIGAGIQANRAMFHAAGQMIANTLKGALIGGVVGVGALVSAGLFKGFQRLESLDRARHQLEALGRSAEEVKQIMADVNDVVIGTPIALNEALAEVPKLLASNVKDIKGSITAIADAAGFAGQPFNELATVFEQVINKGHLMGDEIQQFAERGINITAWLSKSLKMEPADVQKLIDDNRIGIQQVFDAVEANVPGFAKTLGQTIEGAMDQVVTAGTRFFANVISAAFGGDTIEASKNMVDVLDQISAKFDGLSNWVTAHRDQIHQFFTSMGDFARQAGEALGGITSWLMDHPGVVKVALAVWVGAEALSALAGIAKLAAGVKELTTAVTALKAVEMGGIAVDLSAIGSAGTGAAGGIAAAGSAVTALGVAVAGLAGITAPQWLWPLLTGAPLADKLQNVFNKPGPSGPAPNTTTPPATPGASTQVPGQVGAPPGSGIPPLNPSYRQWPSGQGANIVPNATSALGIRKAQELSGLPYTPGTLDCSGYLSQVYSAMAGKPTHFTTMSDFAALGFHPGYMPGALNIGVIPKPGNAGHMAGTLPNGVNIESGGTSGAVTYNSGVGALDPQFTQHWWYMPGYRSGGLIPGSGSGDRVPILVEPGEHVFDRGDVAAMGGQQAVYAFRHGLHMQGGGAIKDIPLKQPRGGGDRFHPDILAPGWDRPPEHWKRYPSITDWHHYPGGKFWEMGPTGKAYPFKFPPKGVPGGRPPDPSEPWSPFDPWWQNRRGVNAFQGGGQVPWTLGNVPFDPNSEIKGHGPTKGGEDGGVWQMPRTGSGRPGRIQWGGKKPSPGGWVFGDFLSPWFRGQDPNLPPPNYEGPKKPSIWFIPPNFLPGRGGRSPYPDLYPDRRWHGFQEGGAVGGISPDILAKANQLGIPPEAVTQALLTGITGGGGIGGQINAIPAKQGEEPVQADLTSSGRTAGFIPAGVSNTGGVPGTSSISKWLGVANEFVGFLIDTGAEVGQAAISAAITAGIGAGASAGGPGAGAAAAIGPAASQAAGFGIKIAASELKRLSSYGFQMAGIGIDALVENIFSPFGGAPRWMGYDYTAFVPSIATQAAQYGITTGEKAIEEAINAGINQATGKPSAQAGGPVSPEHMAGMSAPAQAPQPRVGQPPSPPRTPSPEGLHLGTGKAPGPGVPGGAGIAQPFAPQNPQTAAGAQSIQPQNDDWLSNLIGGATRGQFDRGGWLQPGPLNLTKRPEPVLTGPQWDSISAAATRPPDYAVKIDNIYAMDAEDVSRQIENRQRLAMMRYSGRP